MMGSLVMVAASAIVVGQGRFVILASSITTVKRVTRAKIVERTDIVTKVSTAMATANAMLALTVLCATAAMTVGTEICA